MPNHIYLYDPETSALFIGKDAFGTEVWKQFSIALKDEDGVMQKILLSEGTPQELARLDSSRVQIAVDHATGNSVRAIFADTSIVDTATNDSPGASNTDTLTATSIQAATATNSATITTDALADTLAATKLDIVATANTSKSAKELEAATLIKNISSAHQANAVYASLLNAGHLEPMSHTRDLLAYLGILIFEHRAFPTHQLLAEAAEAHDAYSHVFPPHMVPPVDVLVGAKIEMMEEGAAAGLQVEDTVAVREWSAEQPALEEEERFEGLEKEVVNARLRSVLQECLEMLNKAEAGGKKKKGSKSKRNRKNKKVGKHGEGAGEEEAGEGEAGEKAGVVEEIHGMLK